MTLYFELVLNYCHMFCEKWVVEQGLINNELGEINGQRDQKVNMSVHGEENLEGFIYLNFYHPPTIWNIVRGLFHSPDCLPDNENRSLLSVSMATMLSNGSAERMLGELLLDGIRARFYPENISRLRGFFVFDEIESMSRLWGNNSWGGHFDDDFITDVGVATRRSSRVDSNWISEVFNESGNLKEGWVKAAHCYWSGTAFPNKAPIWERIVEGAATIWSMRPREKALNEIEAIWPQSLGLLAYCCNCGAYGSFDGEIFPVWHLTEDSVRIDYCLRMVDSLNGDFINRVNDFVRGNPKLEASTDYRGDLRLPDLSGFSTELKPDDNTLFGQLVNLLLHSGETKGDQPTE